MAASVSSSTATGGSVPDKALQSAPIESSKTVGAPEVTEPSDSAEPEYITGIKLYFVISSVAIVCYVLLLDTAILSTAIPQITTSFHSLSDVGWYGGAYQLGSAVLQPLTGKFYMHLRNKHVFLTFLGLFELGSLICAVATSSSMLIGGRAIAGLGGSGLMNGALAIIMNAAPLEKRPLYTGLVIGDGPCVWPAIGGAFTEKATWRWCFYINLPIGAICALVIALVHIPDRVSKGPLSLALLRKIIPQLDLPGFGLFAPACIMLLLALQFGGDGTHPWKSAMVIGLLVGAGVVFVLFATWEARVGDQAMIPGALLKHRITLASTIQTMCLMTTVLIGSTWLPTYFQAVRGDSPIKSGVNLLASILSQLVFAVTSGFAVSKLGYYLPWAAFSGALTSIGNGLFSTLDVNTSTAKWIGFLILSGAGRGSGIQMSLVAVQTALPPSLVQSALSFLIFAQNLSTAIGSVIANTIFTQTLITKLPKYAPSISPDQALAAGSSAHAVQALVPHGHKEEFLGVLAAYTEALRNIWYYLVGVAVLRFCVSWGTGWLDVRKKDEGKKANASKSEQKMEDEKTDV